MRETLEDRVLAHAARGAADTADVHAARTLCALVADTCARRLEGAAAALRAASCADRIPDHRKRVQSRAF